MHIHTQRVYKEAVPHTRWDALCPLRLLVHEPHLLGWPEPYIYIRLIWQGFHQLYGRVRRIYRVGQNHIYIYIYGVYTVLLAGRGHHLNVRSHLSPLSFIFEHLLARVSSDDDLAHVC